MSKIKKSETSHYEILYIIPNNFTEDEAKDIHEKVKKVITNQKGKITFFEDWGKKRFAYPIGEFNYGYYGVLEFDLEGKNLEKINELFRMDNKVLRFQIVKKKLRTPEEIEKDRKIAEKIKDKKQKETEKKEDDKKQKETEKKEAKEKKEDDKKVKLKDLDDKLDQLLKTDDLL